MERASIQQPMSTTNQELHELHLSSLVGAKGFPMEAQKVIDHTMLLRAKEKYLFDCEANRKVVSDDPWLRDVWAWIAGESHCNLSVGILTNIVQGPKRRPPAGT